MSQPTPRLPHQTDEIFLTDGGTETWLMYKRGFELPKFSAFHLLNDERATQALREYYIAFAKVAVKLETPFIFDSLTYRASRDWGALLGYSGAITIVKALEAAGKDLSAESFQSGMESLDYKDEISGNHVDYSAEDHQGADEIIISVIQDGNWKELTRQ